MFVTPKLPIRDQAQVRALVQWLKNLDTQGHLGAYFAPADLPSEMSRVSVEEEGWIRGVGREKK